MLSAASTIAAIASPPGAGRRGVIRISGDRAREIVAAACDEGPPAARACYTTLLQDGRGAQPALVLWMPGPHSFTREDVAELHLPGAPSLLSAALERLYALGAEPAQPGEFTRRAFLSGRLDLSRAEGVLSLISARTREERRAATALLAGGLEERSAALRDGLDALRALCEASLDFDETDTGHVPVAELLDGARQVLAGLVEAASWEESRVADPGAPRIVLVGEPNAGKSSLFNRLLGVSAGQGALVDDLAGTTRDTKRGPWTVGGVECLLVDTAGVGQVDGEDALDREAQARARREQAAGDVVVEVVDGTRAPAARAPREDVAGQVRVRVWSKIDDPRAGVAPGGGELPWVSLSARTGRGIDDLTAAIGAALLDARGAGGGDARLVLLRHRRALELARTEVEQAACGLERGEALDLVAERLRAASEALEGLSGRTTPEGLLDRIFSRFCLGK